MTVSSTTSEFSYAGNDVTTAFAFSNVLYEGTSVDVILTSAAGVDTTLTITTHYTVALAGGDFACAVLAQASMAAAAGRTQTRVPVLTSPELALRALLS